MDLLEKYQKLYNWVKSEPSKSEDGNGDQGKMQFFGVINPSRVLSNTEKATEIENFEKFETVLRSECVKLDKELTESSLIVTAQNNNLANFLYDQSSTVSATEQAEALNTKLQRSAQRRLAHDMILSALRGCHMSDDGDLEAGQQVGLMSQVDEITEVTTQLRRLESLEEDTDQLTDRLKVKLEAINLLEESQVEMVDFQVRKGSKVLQRLHEIENTVTQHNEELRIMREKMKAEFYSRLKEGRNAQGGMYKFCSWVLALAVIIFLGFAGMYFLNRLTGGWW